MVQKFWIPEETYRYLASVSLREPEILRRLREETARSPRAQMQISPDQGQFMALLVKLMGAKQTFEVGVFTGYSSLAVALALPDDGRILACDVSEEFTSVARRYWKEAGVERKIDLQIRPAMETLRERIALGERGSYDFAFIDADKPNYDGYYECALELVRPGGLIAIDNVLRAASVVSAHSSDPSSIALHALNRKLLKDERIDLSMLPIADGLTLARKR